MESNQKVKDERAWILWSETAKRMESRSKLIASDMMGVHKLSMIEYQDHTFDLFVSLFKSHQLNRLDSKRLEIQEILYRMTGVHIQVYFVISNA